MRTEDKRDKTWGKYERGAKTKKMYEELESRIRLYETVMTFKMSVMGRCNGIVIDLIQLYYLSTEKLC